MNESRRYKTIGGFSILLFMVLSAWFAGDLFISTFVIPIFLGALGVLRLLNSVPHIIWWTLVIIISFSLLLVKTSMPTLHFSGRREREGEIRLFELDKLVKDSLGSGRYTGQQLSFLLINLYLRNTGKAEVNIREVEKLVENGTLPEELQNFARNYYYEGRIRKKTAIERSTLEEAVKYLNKTIIGDHIYERSSK